VIHQTGAADEASVAALYSAKGISARVNAFEREMGRAFATADVVVARAGASTCFELARVGKPAFFIPLPSAVRDHQHFNADAFVRNGAAFEGRQDSLTPRAIANWILHKIEHPESLGEIAEKMRGMATPDAAARVADIVLSLTPPA
jgi:UDP-N-acetylglucosamine--N-acetylmuramyl-(pentapeptide) pyrophosphoryl-undecaprenol N-acetylglucosamine transferase